MNCRCRTSQEATAPRRHSPCAPHPPGWCPEPDPRRIGDSSFQARSPEHRALCPVLVPRQRITARPAVVLHDSSNYPRPAAKTRWSLGRFSNRGQFEHLHRAFASPRVTIPKLPENSEPKPPSCCPARGKPVFPAADDVYPAANNTHLKPRTMAA